MRNRSPQSILFPLTIACSLLLMSAQLASAQCLRILKVDVNGDRVSLTNVGSGEQAGGYWVCNFPNYHQVNQAVGAGETLVVQLPAGFLTAGDGEVGLYRTGLFANASDIMDYMQYGGTGHQRASVGDAAGLWSSSDFVPLPDNGKMRWLGTSCEDPGNSTLWDEVVPVESQSFSAVKSLFD